MGSWVESNIGGILHEQINSTSVSLSLLRPWLKKQLAWREGSGNQEGENNGLWIPGWQGDFVLPRLTDLQPRCPACRTSSSASPLPSAPPPSAPQRAQHSVCHPPPQAAPPPLRATAAWAPTGAAGPIAAGARAPAPAMVMVVCSLGALAVARALGAAADLATWCWHTWFHPPIKTSYGSRLTHPSYLTICSPNPTNLSMEQLVVEENEVQLDSLDDCYLAASIGHYLEGSWPPPRSVSFPKERSFLGSRCKRWVLPDRFFGSGRLELCSQFELLKGITSLCILLAPGCPLPPELISAAQACAIKSDQRGRVEG